MVNVKKVDMTIMYTLLKNKYVFLSLLIKYFVINAHKTPISMYDDKEIITYIILNLIKLPINIMSETEKKLLMYIIKAETNIAIIE